MIFLSLKVLLSYKRIFAAEPQKYVFVVVHDVVIILVTLLKMHYFLPGQKFIAIETGRNTLGAICETWNVLLLLRICT